LPGELQIRALCVTDCKSVTSKREKLNYYAALCHRPQKSDKETFVVFDETHGHYFLHTLGWQDTKRIWNTIVYVRLKNGKIWIEEDGLEHGIATDLLESGVPKEDIVLAFHHPSVRPWTEFAVA